MNCCLWFNRRKISSAAEISDNMDIAALRGYFLGGSLIEWLTEHDGKEYAGRLEKLDPADPELNRKLFEAFSESPQELPKKEMFCGNTSAAQCCTVGNGSFGSFGSWRGFGSFASSGFGGSYRWGMSGGSFSAGSYTMGSFGSFSRFHLWEWEWEWRFGGSFRWTGSFRGFGSGMTFGSFGMLGFGSYLFGSWGYLLGSFRGVPGIFGGSYAPGGNCWQLSSDEYDRIMYECLRRCPLDSFGYGIHIV